MKITLYGGILCLLFSITSCKKTFEFRVSGKVTNAITGEPLKDVLVVIQDGLSTSSLLSEETSPSVGATTKTNENGEYQLYLKSNESWHAVVYPSSELYVYERIIEGTSQSYEFVGEGESLINFQLQGSSFFSPYFRKYSSPLGSNDKLIFSMLQYESTEKHRTYSDYELPAIGYSSISKEGYSPIPALGDRYLRYKLEWTDNGVWKSKIDSVFLPTSLEVYTDTIFY